MRVAMFIVAVLVFAAGLILDTGAVLQLVGGFLWEHALYTAVAGLILVAVAAGWGRLRRRAGTKKTARAGVTRRSAEPPQKRAGAGRGRTRTGKSARAK